MKEKAKLDFKRRQKKVRRERKGGGAIQFLRIFLAIKHIFFTTLTLNIEVGNLDNKIKKEMTGYTKNQF